MKIGLVSLGCPKNLVDSEVMLGLAREAGHELTGDAAGADVIVVNTCAFIDSAKQESVDAILEMARHKKDGACQRLIVTGCLAERYRNELRAEIPEIDAVLGTGEVPEIVNAIAGLAAGTSPLSFYRAPSTEHPAPGTLPNYIYDADTEGLRDAEAHACENSRGCDYKCGSASSTLRTAYRSRPRSPSFAKRALCERGVKELLLIPQDTTFYGIDRQERGALARLLRALNGIDGLEWIRLLYLYPTTIDDERRWPRWPSAIASANASIFPLQRLERRPQAHETPRHTAEIRAAAPAYSRPGSRRGSSNHVHRRFPW